MAKTDEAMKIQLWMRGQNKAGHVALYRTVTEDEFVDIARLVLARDGSRPWERREVVDHG